MPPLNSVTRVLAFAVVALGGAISAQSGAPTAPQAKIGAEEKDPVNVLVLVLDDVGVDHIGAYGWGDDLPPTPNFDALADRGILFLNAWASPVCSPTRAAMLTGRYGFRTGVGRTVNPGDVDDFGLPDEEITLPELLAQGTSGLYSSAHFGKWHVTPISYCGPMDAGFDHSDGLRGNIRSTLGETYYSFENVVSPGSCGTPSNVVGPYATTYQVDAASAWINSRTEPWFCYVGFNAAHQPFHEPPAHLHTQDLSNPMSLRPFYKAAIEAMDTEIGRLLAEIPADVLDNTLVFLIGDNGSLSQTTIPPFFDNRAKGTVYEGGVRVPFTVAGPGVTEGAVSTALVHVVDIFATTARVAGVNPKTALPGVTIDGVSMVPYFSDPGQPSLRSTVFTEIFFPNGPDAGLPITLPPDPDNVCQTDIGLGGPGVSALTMCGPILAPGNMTPVELTGALPNVLGFFLQSDTLAPGPGYGGTIIDPNATVVPFFTDANGEKTVLISGNGGPQTMYYQIATEDPGQSGGFAVSNAIQADFVPDNRKAIRTQQFKLISSVNGGPDQFYDLTLDPFEQVDLLTLGPLNATQQAAFDDLKQELADLLASP